MPIFAREAELYKLKSALADCLSGRPNVTVLEGPAGCGKTALLDALMEQASAEGAVVLRAAALSSERDLPLSVMRQLAESAPASDDIGRCLAALSAGDMGSGDPPDAVTPGRAHAGEMFRACADLRAVAHERPVVIGVDDAHHADDRSLRRLLYIAARARATGLMMVFTEVLHHRQWSTAYRDVFLQQPEYRRMRLTSLDPDGVTSLVNEHARMAVDDLLVDGLHAATGGNPLLIRALLEDHLTASAVPDPSERLKVLTGGEVFAHAILTCVDRSGPVAARVAEGLAVLGDAAGLDLLRRLCRLPLAVAELGTRVLRATGVTEDFGFRHSAARTAVLDGMDPGRRRELHSRAAALLYADGASVVSIAAHLRNAERVEEPWGVPVLQEAAEEVLADDRDTLAIAYLDLAYRFCPDARQRVEIRLRSAVILQRGDPWAAERLGDELLLSLRTGELTAQHRAKLANVLTGQGRIEDAGEVFGTLRRLGEGESPVPVDWAAGPRALVGGRHHPWVSEDVGERPGDDGSSYQGSVPGPGTTTGYEVVPWAGPVPAAGDEITAAAQELLQRCVLTDSTVEAISSAIKCLTYGGGADRAQYWSGVLLKEADRRGASGWSAHFAGLQAEGAYHQGDIRRARDLARLGLERISGPNRSLLACSLLAAQIMSETVMGDYEAGARMLNQPTPESLLGSTHGLTYIRARGHYHLATDRLDDALDDFMSVGQLARRWGTDIPAWLPWRGDTAEVLLRLGQREEAERLVVEQEARIADNCGRARGMTLRLLAATAPPDRRLPILARSMSLLHGAGDRLELARTLYDLADVYRRLGETAQAAMASRRAWQLARECGAEPLCSGGHLEHGEDHRNSGGMGSTAVDVSTVRLSSSERRVAVLAACGYTNRDISSRLSVTISTVEQHLTGVYRKFKICGREQLPLELQFEVEDIA
ncbi:helix-turn-helix transcriptional regulator [Streptomyces sp. SBT349]|uniref:helix-turn-helix transcriptional regulator n=1 Tax=Streptomyces sp. SBT349 TaxID=1580539 RepID=UPI00066A4178|nr:LuxR family transcriptional regulator [Streptomyces sp. SBT349]